jgi:hypothetical protein
MIDDDDDDDDDDDCGAVGGMSEWQEKTCPSVALTALTAAVGSRKLTAWNYGIGLLNRTGRCIFHLL